MQAICILHQTEYSGYILFTEKNTHCEIEVNLQGLPPGKRGFHIHERGNLLEGCKSLCAHFNPTNKNHGPLNSKDSHVGDLGNIEVNQKGKVNCIIKAKRIKLKGKNSIIGRSVVIHQKEDDCGKGTNKDSLITGNAGKRIACGIIGYY